MRHFSKICNSFELPDCSPFNWHSINLTVRRDRVDLFICGVQLSYSVDFWGWEKLVKLAEPRRFSGGTVDTHLAPSVLVVCRQNINLDNVDEYMRVKAAEIEERELLAATSKASEKGGMRL